MVQQKATYSDKVGVFCIPHGDNGVYFLDQLLLLVIIKVHVPLGQSGLACPVLDQDKPDLQVWREREATMTTGTVQ